MPRRSNVQKAVRVNTDEADHPTNLILDVQWHTGKEFSKSNKSILYAPTGSSKTVIAFCAAVDDAKTYCEDNHLDDMSKCLVIFCGDKAIAAQHVLIMREVCGVRESLFTDARKIFSTGLPKDKPVILSQSHAQLGNLLKTSNKKEEPTGYEKVLMAFERVLIVYDEVHDVLVQTKKTTLHSVIDMRAHIRAACGETQQSLLRVIGLTATPEAFMKGDALSGYEVFEKGSRGLDAQERWMKCVMFCPDGTYALERGVEACSLHAETVSNNKAAWFMGETTYTLPENYVHEIRYKLPHTTCKNFLTENTGEFPHIDKMQLLRHFYFYMWIDTQLLPNWSKETSPLLLHKNADTKFFKQRKEEYARLVDLSMVDTLYDQITQTINGAPKIGFVHPSDAEHKESHEVGIQQATEEESSAWESDTEGVAMQPASILLSAESIVANAYLFERLQTTFTDDRTVVLSSGFEPMKRADKTKTTTMFMDHVDEAIREQKRIVAVVSDSFMQGYNGLNSRFSHLILVGERSDKKVTQARGRMERPVDPGMPFKPSTTNITVFTVGWLAAMHALPHTIGRTRGVLSRNTRSTAKIPCEVRACDAMVAQMVDVKNNGDVAARMFGFQQDTTPQQWLALLHAEEQAVRDVAIREKGLFADEALQLMLKFAQCTEATGGDAFDPSPEGASEDMVHVNVCNAMDMSLYGASNHEADDVQREVREEPTPQRDEQTPQREKPTSQRDAPTPQRDEPTPQRDEPTPQAEASEGARVAHRKSKKKDTDVRRGRSPTRDVSERTKTARETRCPERRDRRRHATRSRSHSSDAPHWGAMARRDDSACEPSWFQTTDAHRASSKRRSTARSSRDSSSKKSAMQARAAASSKRSTTRGHTAPFKETATEARESRRRVRETQNAVVSDTRNTNIDKHEDNMSVIVESFPADTDGILDFDVASDSGDDASSQYNATMSNASSRTQPASIAAPLPCTESAPMAEPSPRTQAAPIAEPSPPDECVSITETSPRTQSAPIAEPQPLTESVPVSEASLRTESASIADPSALNESVSITETSPRTQSAPVAEPQPLTESVPESAPVAEPSPLDESVSITEASPRTRSAPIAESVPVREASPRTESAPIAEPRPLTESVPVSELSQRTESVSITEPSPRTESAPIVEPLARTESASESVPITEPSLRTESLHISDLAPTAHVEVNGAVSVEEVPTDTEDKDQLGAYVELAESSVSDDAKVVSAITYPERENEIASSAVEADFTPAREPSSTELEELIAHIETVAPAAVESVKKFASDSGTTEVAKRTFDAACGHSLADTEAKKARTDETDVDADDEELRDENESIYDANF